ncbi:AraC family transcriptional regulator [Chryseolinea sp. T2]|uniref:helix-turn-helix domain-containing protein n=1 Tax=Chryseolinea sp. T2 TaxID=3129255 RepID=UPI00307889B1
MNDKAEPVRKLFIKNMVCDRCSMVVRQELEKIGMKPLHVALGEVTLRDEPSTDNLQRISDSLSSVGFSLIDDKKSLTIEQIKNAIIDIVQRGKPIYTNLSEHLAQLVGRDYSYLSNLFSEVEGTTIEQFYILQKIEKAKELLVYGELTLSQIASDLGYSSVAHLSNQFKKVTGLTPSHFKKVKDNKRKPIDRI